MMHGSGERAASDSVVTASDRLVSSQTRPGVSYRVTLGIDGAAVCTCAGWEFRGTCPHIEIALRRDQ